MDAEPVLEDGEIVDDEVRCYNCTEYSRLNLYVCSAQVRYV